MGNICEWYKLCERRMDGWVAHPVIGWVPTCSRCAQKHQMELKSHYDVCLTIFSRLDNDVLFSEGMTDMVAPGEPTRALEAARQSRV